jgi:hypothetical protein
MQPGPIVTRNRSGCARPRDCTERGAEHKYLPKRLPGRTGLPLRPLTPS